MNALGMQVAFVIPLCVPLVYAASVHHAAWFYPAFMVVVGAHYLPFIFLYGMPHFGALAAILVTAGIAIALYLPRPFSVGAWFTTVILLLFAMVGLRASRR